MSSESRPTDKQSDDGFSEMSRQSQPGMMHQIWELLRYNKSWWLTPIILMLLLAGVLLILGGSAAAPFIYTLF